MIAAYPRFLHARRLRPGVAGTLSIVDRSLGSAPFRRAGAAENGRSRIRPHGFPRAGLDVRRHGRALRTSAAVAVRPRDRRLAALSRARRALFRPLVRSPAPVAPGAADPGGAGGAETRHPPAGRFRRAGGNTPAHGAQSLPPDSPGPLRAGQALPAREITGRAQADPHHRDARRRCRVLRRAAGRPPGKDQRRGDRAVARVVQAQAPRARGSAEGEGREDAAQLDARRLSLRRLHAHRPRRRRRRDRGRRPIGRRFRDLPSLVPGPARRRRFDGQRVGPVLQAQVVLSMPGMPWQARARARGAARHPFLLPACNVEWDTGLEEQGSAR
jgi:hypothetical protein